MLVLFRQTDILEKQTEILARQSSIQENQLEFEKQKNWTDTAKEYREQMNNLYDRITYADSILSKIHNSIKAGEKINDIQKLNRYVNEFENIWALFCDWKIKKSDLVFILKSTIEPVCWNSQIFNYYQNTKSWLSWMCEVLFPWSSVMAKYKDPNKCVILKNDNK